MTKSKKLKFIVLTSLTALLSSESLPAVSLADVTNPKTSTTTSSNNQNTTNTQRTLTKTPKSLGPTSVTNNQVVDTNDLDLSSRSPQDIYKTLTPEQKSMFDNLVKEQNMTPAEQSTFLKIYDPYADTSYGIKSKIAYRALKYAANFSGRFASAGFLEYHANKLAGAMKGGSSRARKAIYNFLRGLGVSKSNSKRISTIVEKAFF